MNKSKKLSVTLFTHIIKEIIVTVLSNRLSEEKNDSNLQSVKVCHQHSNIGFSN